MSPELFEAVRVLARAAVPVSVAIHDTDASHVAGDAAKYPFLVLSGGVTRDYGDGVGWCRDESTALVRVTHTALSAGAVRSLLRMTRSVLVDAAPIVEGWHAFGLSIEDSQGVEVDRDVKVVNGNTAQNPFYAVDIYRVQATR